jgi:integrase
VSIWITVPRGIVHQHIGGLKTEESGKPVLEPSGNGRLESMAQNQSVPEYHRLYLPFSNDGGQQPFWPCSMLRKVIRPAAIRAKITKRIGWHAQCGTLATLLVGQGTLVKLTQEMLRHANSRITLELYAQSNMAAKLEAQRVLLKDMVGTWGLEPQTSTVSR